MNDGSIQRIYRFYEVINDFNRIRILICLDNEERTIEDISQITGLSIPIVSSQLAYLYSYGIVLKNENEDDEYKSLYKIKDKTMIRIVDNIIKYTNKER